MDNTMNRALEPATYARMFDPDPDEDFIVRRAEAIKDLRGRLLKRRRIPELITTVSGMCEVFLDPSAIPDSIRHQVEDVIEKNDGSFVAKDRNLEVGLCAIAAINQSIASGIEVEKWKGWSVSDVLAGCVWSALSFLPQCNGRKLDALRKWTIQNARDRLHAKSAAARQRYQVSAAKEFGGRPVDQNSYAAAVDAIKELQINAMLDKEEIELLRWVMAGKSHIYSKQLASLSSENRPVTAGVEIGGITQAPPSVSHRDYLLCGLGEREPLSLGDLLGALGEGRVRIANSFIEKSLLKEAQVVFPLLSGICCGEATSPGADLPRPLSEWGARALLEHALFRVRL